MDPQYEAVYTVMQEKNKMAKTKWETQMGREEKVLLSLNVHWSWC